MTTHLNSSPSSFRPYFLVALLALQIVAVSPAENTVPQSSSKVPPPDAFNPLRDNSPPFSFQYGDRSSKDFLSGWVCTEKLDNDTSGRVSGSRTYSDREKGMSLELQTTEYPAFGASEWVLRFSNDGDTNSDILSDIWAMDVELPCEASSEVLLHYADGSQGGVDDFRPRQRTLGVDSEIVFSPNGGRSSDGVLPYFNLVFPGRGGIIVAVGWTGQWKAVFGRNKESHLTLHAGMEQTHLKLDPGERIRTPSILVLPYSGDRQAGHNTLRRFLLQEIFPKPAKDPMNLPIAASGATIGFSSITEINQITAIHNLVRKEIPVDTWWIDAGWSLGGFPMGMGNPDPDPARFPRGLKPVADEAHKAGLRFLLWFEPERVMPNTWLMGNHKEWLLRPSNLPKELQYQSEWALLDLGNKETLDWIKGKISRDIGEYGVDIYRHDFNMHPLHYWRTGEEEDRQGIREIRYIEGLYEFFDFLRSEHPALLIDNCASGGRRLDFEMMKRSVPLWRSDYCWDPIGGQSITFGLSDWLPLHGLGAVSEDPYSFRSGLGTNVSFAFDYYNPDALFWGNLRERIEEYRQVRNSFAGDFYPLVEYTTSPKDWIAWQYHRPDLDTGVLQAFKREECENNSQTLRLRGLLPDADYELTDLDSGEKSVRSGLDLLEKGVAVSSPDRPSSMLIEYKVKNRQP